MKWGIPFAELRTSKDQTGGLADVGPERAKIVGSQDLTHTKMKKK